MNHSPPSSRTYQPAALVASGRALGFYVHLIAYVFTNGLLLITAGLFPMLVVALGWGIGVAVHGLFALLLPILHARAQAAAFDRVKPHSPAAHALAVATDAQRARSLEELSAAIAHEIRNPITAAKSLVQQIAEDPSALDAAEHARVAVGELDRVERSIAHLLRFAREEPFEPVALNMNELIESAIQRARERAAREHVRIERDVERLPSVVADGDQLLKVLSNLIGNALDAHAQRPREDAFVKISAGQNLAGDELWIRVADNGPGVAVADREQVFRPFYTRKANGTGLGLALSRKILVRHGGTLELVSPSAQGAEFLLTLPRRAQQGD